jgi:hypothetical protein
LGSGHGELEKDARTSGSVAVGLNHDDSEFDAVAGRYNTH